MSERKPLTLEELRKMELEPVWLITYSSKNKIPRISQWALVASSSNYSVSFVCVAVSGRMEKKCEDYGKTWVAFAHEPYHLDRSAWEPCMLCAVGYWKQIEYSFCPCCGRPLTDAAWEMLERRIARHEQQ